MVKLRLRRMGRKKRPVYDIVATDERTPRDGRFLEKVGQYDPLIEGNTVTILKRDRVLHWMRSGAQPTDTVRNLLSREGVMLELHMHRKGRSEEEIATALEEHRARHEARHQAAGTRKQQKPAEPETEVADQGVATTTDTAEAEPKADVENPERDVVHESSATEESVERDATEPPTSINETSQQGGTGEKTEE